MTRIIDATKKIIDASNFIVRYACEETTSGNWIIDIDEVTKASGLDYFEVYDYLDEILDELYSREEILDAEFDNYYDHFDVTCALAYCPNYEWMSGDEEVFGCSFKEWLDMPTEPIVDKK